MILTFSIDLSSDFWFLCDLISAWDSREVTHPYNSVYNYFGSPVSWSDHLIPIICSASINPWFNNHAVSLRFRVDGDRMTFLTFIGYRRGGEQECHVELLVLMTLFLRYGCLVYHGVSWRIRLSWFLHLEGVVPDPEFYLFRGSSEFLQVPSNRGVSVDNSQTEIPNKCISLPSSAGRLAYIFSCGASNKGCTIWVILSWWS